MKSLLIPLCFGFLTVFASAGEANWPRFRGGDGAGEGGGAELPETWGVESAKWSVELAGEGHSSPVIWGGKVFVTSAVERGASRVLQCFDLQKGGELWRVTQDSAIHKRHKNNSYASSTPTVDGERVYVMWGQPKSIMVVAYTHTGKEVWRNDLGAYKSGHGFGVSPIVAGGKLIVW